MGIELSPGSGGVLLTFLVYLIGVAALGVFAHRYVSRGSFVKEYFLGNRGLGPWVLALTIAATAISGGTFMGFPSFVYTNGWVMAIWICAYMVVPLTGVVWFGKRINQIGRLGGSVTIPDIYRDRFDSPALGILASILILVFTCFNLVAQFKAGGIVMQTALRLRPTTAQLVDTTINAERYVVLKFETPHGRDEQRTPLPTKTAVLDRTEVDEAKREVKVHFLDGDKASTRTVRFPPARMAIPWMDKGVEKGYLLGLVVFALTVIAYTTYGGFWAVTWTDVLEGLVMLFGVVIMAFLALQAVPAIETESGTLTGLAAATERLRQPDMIPGLVQGPGPDLFLPLGMGFSFFLMWSVSSAGQPSGMVRLMSFKDTPSLRRALVLLGVYYVLTYVCLLVIFICARAIFPTEYLRQIGTEGEPDAIMPEMVRYLTDRAGVPWLAGLLLAAPYAAIMSTVAAFLLLISSSLVRDLYQRTINPNASERALKRVSYVTTALVGVVVMFGAINPPDYLQYFIIFTGSGQSCAFFFPMVLTLYWRRATRQGMLAGMLGGALTVVLLYVLGWLDGGTRGATVGLSGWCQNNLSWLPGWGQPRLGSSAPLNLAGFDPIVWGFLASVLLSIGVSLRTTPDSKLVEKYFP